MFDGRKVEMEDDKVVLSVAAATLVDLLAC